MPAHALPREAAVFVESTFATGPADWDADATEIYIIEPDVSSLQQTVLDNENIRPRPAAVHQKILGLLSEGTWSCGMYMHASPATAAEAAQAVATIQSDIIKCAMGGRSLGYSIGFSGGSASAPEIDADPGYVAGDWIFAYDTSSARGEFYQIQSLAGLVLTLDRDLHFTPDGGGADVAHAVIVHYVDQAAATNHASADHTTLSWKIQGEGSEDVFEINGCKPASFELEGITAGEPVKWAFEWNQVQFAWETATKTTFTATPSGSAPLVPGTGDDTIVRLAVTTDDMAAAAALVTTRGTITPNFALTYDKDMGPNGLEGVHGYVGAGWGEGGPQLIVEFDDDYGASFRAQDKFKLLVQVGTNNASSWAVYWSRLEFAAEPQRVDEGGLTSSSLSFRAMEGAALTSNDKGRSPFMVLMVA